MNCVVLIFSKIISCDTPVFLYFAKQWVVISWFFEKQSYLIFLHFAKQWVLVFWYFGKQWAMIFCYLNIFKTVSCDILILCKRMSCDTLIFSYFAKQWALRSQFFWSSCLCTAHNEWLVWTRVRCSWKKLPKDATLNTGEDHENDTVWQALFFFQNQDWVWRTLHWCKWVLRWSCHSLSGLRIKTSNDRIAEKVIKISKALHYMCPEALYTEAFRVLRPGGLLAIAGYHFSRSLCLFSCESTLLMESLSSSAFSQKKKSF